MKKKTYNAPKATAIQLYVENDMAGLLILSGQGSDTPSINNDEGILSNKKENPIWGEQHNGMWDNMN